MVHDQVKIEEQVSLRRFNTFGIDVCAERFAEIYNEAQLPAVAQLPWKKSVLGGGSNILLCNEVKGLVLHNALKGKKILRENPDQIWIEAASGEVWHELVLYAIERGWGGMENLALIPGTVGAAPIQNIGAYGVEVKDIIEEVVYFNWDTRQIQRIGNAECEFGYRDSIFKHALRGKVMITRVVFRLSKKPVVNLLYGAIKTELQQMGVEQPAIRDVAEAVIRIRTEKLPDPGKAGNAGSFFKNPEVRNPVFEELEKKFPDIPSYDMGTGIKKIPAGWLIEQCGWKGYSDGKVGVHERQALVLVNRGGANGADILSLAGKITDSVAEKFGITLEREVQVWSAIQARDCLST